MSKFGVKPSHSSLNVIPYVDTAIVKHFDITLNSNIEGFRYLHCYHVKCHSLPTPQLAMSISQMAA